MINTKIKKIAEEKNSNLENFTDARYKNKIEKLNKKIQETVEELRLLCNLCIFVLQSTSLD